MFNRVLTIAAFVTLALASCLALTGCGTENMDEGARTSLGIALGVAIVAASTLGFAASGRHFGRKRQRNARRNRARSNSKKRKRR